MAQAKSSWARVIGLGPGQEGKRILIVEDQLENRMLLRKLFEPLGLNVREALNGEEAVEIFAQWRPHLIWMDRRMPVMDGLEASQRIREMEGGRETIIVALTASAFDDQKKEVMAAGLDDFISKPCRTDQIYECMGKHLGLHYRYADEPTAVLSHPKVEVQMEALNGLPQELLEELYTMALTLDIVGTREVVERITEVDEVLADGLRQLVDGMDFSTLQVLLAQCDR